VLAPTAEEEEEEVQGQEEEEGQEGKTRFVNLKDRVKGNMCAARTMGSS
jgi:hypothetical protein